MQNKLPSLFLILFCSFSLWADDGPDLKSEIKGSVDAALAYLRTVQKDGKWMNNPGITALCLRAYLVSPRQYVVQDGPFLRKPMNWLISLQDEEGAVYDPDSRKPVKNYTTSLALQAFVAAKGEAYQKNIDKAVAYLISLQSDEGEDYDREKDYFYGGIGYGGDQRPDLSNTQFALEALHDAGVSVAQPVFQKALVFLNRCQDIEANEMEWSGASGGFAYSPDVNTNLALPNKKGESNPIAPYGSMTFAGLKSLIYCGVEKNDPRVQAALGWVSKNIAFDHHPNMGDNSYYYYLYTMARTFEALQMKDVKLADGSTVNWAKEMSRELLKRQQTDGSWVNKKGKYMESIPELVTGYAVIALSIAREQL